MLIIGQKSCILGPTIFKIPQPNCHYYVYSTRATITRGLYILILLFEGQKRLFKWLVL